MPDADRPQELPARLLTDPEMIHACRVRDFGRVFRLVKVRAGIYPSMIARRCELTPSRVGEVIAGRRQLLHMNVVERIANGLRIPGHMLGLARRPWETPQALVTTESEAPQAPDPAPQTPASVPGPDVDSILALATRTSLRTATLEEFRSSIEYYWRRDDQHGGEALRPAIVGQLRHVVGPLKESRPPSIQNGLYGIVAELARLFHTVLLGCVQGAKKPTVRGPWLVAFQREYERWGIQRNPAREPCRLAAYQASGEPYSRGNKLRSVLLGGSPCHRVARQG